MDSTFTHKHYQLKKNIPDINSGDRVRVHQKIREGNKERIQVFEGLVIKTQHGNGINGTFTVRRIASGVGVEKLFPLHSPVITKIEKVRSAKVRRAKLYYVRGLIGKAARRLKKEKEDLAIWEDVIADEPETSEEASETEVEEGPEETISPEKTEEESANKEEKTETKDEQSLETEEKETKDDKPAKSEKAPKPKSEKK